MTTAPAFAAELGRRLAQEAPGVRAVLFYGSALRTGARDGVLDFYVLTAKSPPGLRGLASRLLWPDVSYREVGDPEGLLRAKIATLTLDQFQRAVRGEGVDTTVWARFVQPSAMVWAADPVAAGAVELALEQAAQTAAGFAAVLRPGAGPPAAFWRALFRQTYAAEFRVEPIGREDGILDVDPARYASLLREAWDRSGIEVRVSSNGDLEPVISPRERRRRLRAWWLRRAMGRPLNIARLVKAAFTFDGAARYAAWKVERHTGIALQVTPWRERHPVLAAPGALIELWRARAAKRGV